MAVSKSDVQAVKDLMAKTPWITYVDAARQVRGTPTPTPPTVTPTTPTPTPTAPAPLTPTVNTIDNKQELLQSTKWLTSDQRRAVMQNQAGTTPNVADQTPTPVTPPVTPTPTPTTPVTPPVKETVTPIKTEVKWTPEVKTPDFNTSVGRENEINQNLANITASNQALLTDRNAFNQTFWYSTADDGKKALLDSFFQSKQAEITNPDTLYKTILSGAVIPESLKNTPNYKTALQRANNYKKFTSYSPTQLEASLLNGDLLPWTQIYNDLYNDPAMKAKLDQAKQINQINGKSLNVEEAGVKKTSELMNWPLATALSDNYLTQEEKDALINTDEVKAAATKLQEEKLALNELEQAYKNVDIEVGNEYKGRSLTSSQIAQIKANRRKDLAPDLELARENYATNYWFYTELKTNALNLFADNLSLYKEQKAQQEQIASEERQYQNALKLDQAKFDQQIANQAKLLNDPQTAINSVMQEYKALGVPFIESLQTKVQKANDFINSGKWTLSDYIDQMIKDAQAKPEYQQYMAYQKAKMTQEVKNTTDYKVIGKDAQWNDVYGFVNTANQTVTPSPSFSWVGTGADFRTLATKYPNEASLKNNNPAWITWNSNFDKWTGFASILRENGVNFEKGTARPINEWGNYVSFPTVEDGMKAYDLLWSTDRYQNMTVQNALNTWGTGSLNLWPINPNSKISQLTPDQVTQIKNAQLKKESPWFFKELNNLKQQSQPKELTPALIENFNSLTATDKNKKQSDPTYIDFLNKKANVMNDENASIYDVMKYSQGWKDMWEERLKSLWKFSQALSQVEDLTKSINNNVTWPIIWRLSSYNPYDANAQALVAQINSVVPNIARGVYGEVGVLTDADIQNYAKTLPNIKSTEDTNKLVLAMTLQTMVNGFKSQLQTDWSAGRDVSWFGGTVKQYETRINNLLSQIGGNTQTTTTPVNNKYLDIVKNTK